MIIVFSLAIHILNLPFEITMIIFEHYLPQYPRRPLAVDLALFGWICGQWRAVAFAAPRLWRAFTMNLNAMMISHQAKALQEWLRRSGTLPISIDILLPADQPCCLQEMNNIVSLILAHSCRWEHTRIGLMLPFESLRLLQGRMPVLRSLIIGPTEVPMPPPASPISLFGESPCLDTVRLSRCFEPDYVTLPWTNLTWIEADFLYPEECVTI
ncbi:hypothetical protein R3P38DRAFT_2575846 [Favolaschia claudopus]|uniref:F-box domain-containing protein n=1 Tax=Favolaschia claudopus TaxID=2862362 RepID=A0AAV9ZJR4_9AGAR